MKGSVDMKRFDLIIVGAGPSGLSAAIEAAKRGLEVVVFDENEKPGGQLFKQIHKFFGSKEHKAKIRGFKIGEDLLNEADEAGVKVVLNATVCGMYQDKELPTYEFRDAVLNETVYGWGYPQAMNSKSTEIEGTCISITGKVGHVISDRYVLNYEAPTRERGVSRHDEMSGYSGTGLFQRENEKVYFTGCLSGAAGEESAGSRVWIHRS